MVISRRKFLEAAVYVGSGCYCTGVLAARSKGQRRGFVCASKMPQSTTIQYRNYSPEEKRRFDKFKITDYGTQIYHQRWKKKDGLDQNSGKIVLGCNFLEGEFQPSIEDKDLVKLIARGWLRGGLEDYIDLRFDVPKGEAHIRILLGANTNSSKIGPKDHYDTKIEKPTMKLRDYDNPWTIEHEFGHALGLRHESKFPGGIKFNESVVIDYFRKNEHWSERDTRLFVIDPLGKESICRGDQAFNRNSVMLYEIPPEWTKDNQVYSGSNRISQQDINCMLGVYGPVI